MKFIKFCLIVSFVSLAAIEHTINFEKSAQTFGPGVKILFEQLGQGAVDGTSNWGKVGGDFGGNIGGGYLLLLKVFFQSLMILVVL